jgi:A/G-specific adenine glycosylase
LPDGGLLANEFAKALIVWYDKNKRILPWRETTEPYAIWVSEIMLQQTQIATVIPYYQRWMEKYPTIEKLALAKEQDVLSLWQGLGYYKRCRQLLESAKWVAENGMPDSAASWLKVPGVGPYTSAAIASIAFGEAVAVVDGNVERVYARVVGSRSEGTELKRDAQKWATRNLNKRRPGDWNQAVMELGATICTPRKPQCGVCPIEPRCVARHSWQQVEDLPVRSRKEKTESLRHVVWIPSFEGKLGVRKIKPGQWWEGMWEFPRVDSTSLSEDEVEKQLRTIVGPGWLQEVGLVKHHVTRFRIAMDASIVRCESRSRKLRWHTLAELKALPMPTSQRKVLRLALDVL